MGAGASTQLAAPLRGYPTDSSEPGYHHSSAHAWRRLRFSRGRWILASLAETFAAEKKHFGVLLQVIGDGRGNGGVVEDGSMRVDMIGTVVFHHQHRGRFPKARSA